MALTASTTLAGSTRPVRQGGPPRTGSSDQTTTPSDHAARIPSSPCRPPVVVTTTAGTTSVYGALDGATGAAEEGACAAWVRASRGEST
jgi:hypothetical protein